MNRLIAILAGAVIGAFVVNKLLKKSIFISYCYDADSHYKNLLKAWSKNHQFDIDFDDFSNDISVDSDDSKVIMAEITKKINKSDIFLCLIGPDTFNSTWVKKEIRKAVELKKPIVAVKIDKSYKSPGALKDVGASWAMSFTEESIVKALNGAVQ